MFSEIPIRDLTAPTLLGILVLCIIFGRLVPWTVLRDARAEAERWRLAYETERSARAISDSQTSELLESARTTESFIRAVFANSAKIAQTGEPDGAPPPT